MRRSLGCIVLALLLHLFFPAPLFSQIPTSSTALDQRLVGNVYGVVRDAATSSPIAGAKIFLFDPSLLNTEKSRIVQSNGGLFFLPDARSATRRGMTDARGEFLINFVPTPYPFKLYTIVVESPGYKSFVIERARVLPGAVMALRVDGRLEKGRESQAIVFDGGSPNAPLRYRHETPDRAVPPRPRGIPYPKIAAVTHTVFATREGLIGGTTANRHVIVARDHFVALPSVRALNADDHADQFQVELRYGDKTVREPVWDVGPWNTSDDYWHPSPIRESWQDLPQGTPEAQAAYSSGYNGGRDEFGRPVLNPAGIDLADGTFWDDLALTDNQWVSVAFLWRPGVAVGQRVQTTATLNVRSAPAGSLVGQVPAGATGTITGGPLGAMYSQYFWVWWNIQWDDGVTRGWSVENWLIAINKPTAAHVRWSLYR